MTTVHPAVSVRPSGAADLAGLDALVDRCSPATIYRRFHGAAGRPARRLLARFAVPAGGHRSFVAVSPAGEVRGTATLADDGHGGADVAFLVEDAWFRRGVGRALFVAVAAEARRRGLDTVGATVQADNEPALRFLRSLAPGARLRYAGIAEVEATIPIPAGRPAATSVPTREEAA
jgi:ribosomal protein S18 acetylase RimI-like enzyme